MADTTTLIDAIATNLGDALGAMTGTAVRTRPTVGEADVAWQVAVQVAGSAAGTVWLGLTQDGATQLVATILGDPSLVADADIVAATSPVAIDAQHFDLLVGTADPIRLVGWGRTIPTGQQPGRTVAAAAAPPVTAAAAPAPSGTTPRNLDVVLDIELPITVRFGETQMTLESLARLGPGSMIDLDRSPDDPVDLLVNGRLVARGQVVVVSGCYGIRVNEVVSPADRLRSLEL